MRFKADCSLRWKPLADAVGEEEGEVVGEMTSDSVTTVDLLFPSYGQVCGIPSTELE